MGSLKNPASAGEPTRPWLRIAAPLIIFLADGSNACAPMSPYNPDRLAPAQMSRIGEICHTVMGLPAGPYVDYQACEQSLSHSLAARRERSVITAEAVETTADQALAARPAAPPVKSYFLASNDEVHRRAQQACAEISRDPVASAQCVAELESNLFAAGHPLQGR